MMRKEVPGLSRALMFLALSPQPTLFLLLLYVPALISPGSNQNPFALKLRSALGKALGITVAKSSPSSPSCMLVC